jgi:dihydropteroate synthase
MTGQQTINIKGTLMEVDKPLVMAILNITGDSFYDGGHYNNVNQALYRAEDFIKKGAKILDVGGASSRPGAKEVSVDEELSRVLPVVQAISSKLPNAVISIDTYKAQVAREAINSGAHIVNDISAGEDDVDMIAAVADLGVPYIAMHKQGKPQNMQDNPTYTNVVEDVVTYFRGRLEVYQKAGIKDVILDPGFGFGKSVEHNYSLLNQLGVFRSLFPNPLLVGVSRKSMINRVLGTKPEEALNGTTALHAIALMNGAQILRVHDVEEAVQVVQLYEALSGTS